MFLSLFAILFVGVLLTGCDYSVTDPGNSNQPFEDERSVLIEGDSFSGELFISFTGSQMLAKENGVLTNYPLFYGSEGLFCYKIITDGEQILAEGNLTTNNDTARTTLTMPNFMGKQTLKLLIGIKKDINSNPIYTLLPEGVTVAMVLNGRKITLIHHEWYQPDNGKPAYVLTVGPDKCNCGIRITQGEYNRNFGYDVALFGDSYSKWTHDLQLIHASLPHNTITWPTWDQYLQCNDEEYNPYLITNLSDWQAVPTNHNQFTGANGINYHEFYLYIVLPETPNNDDILFNFVGNIPPTVTSIGRTIRNSRNVTRTSTNSFQAVHGIAVGQGLTMLKFGVQNGTIVQPTENISY
jgi:uncharacterized membrane protein